MFVFHLSVSFVSIYFKKACSLKVFWPKSLCLSVDGQIIQRAENKAQKQKCLEGLMKRKILTSIL